MRTCNLAMAILLAGTALTAAAPASGPVPTNDGIRLSAGGTLVRFGTPRAIALRLRGRPGSRPVGDCGQGTPMGEATFADGLILAFIDDKFVGWDLGKGKGPPIGTDRGIGIGATRAAVKRAYPAMTVDDGPLGLMFESDDSPSGFLDANRPSGRVTGLFAGETCKVS